MPKNYKERKIKYKRTKKLYRTPEVTQKKKKQKVSEVIVLQHYVLFILFLSRPITVAGKTTLITDLGSDLNLMDVVCVASTVIS